MPTPLPTITVRILRPAEDQMSASVVAQELFVYTAAQRSPDAKYRALYGPGQWHKHPNGVWDYTLDPMPPVDDGQ